MTIDVIVATYNREELLAKLLRSIFRARVPDGLGVRVIVADNNSADGTRAAVERLGSEWPHPIEYVFERRQGKSFAVNTALAAATADIVGFLDDDEEMDDEWFITVSRVMADPTVTFCSGPYLPAWGAAVPSWLPAEYSAIIGCVDGGQEMVEYGRTYAGTMMGGNAAARTLAVKRLGGFDTRLGRTGSNLCGCEDADLSHRLVASGARGLYVPQMRIYHYVPAERVTKKYYRRWCLHHGVTRARADALRPLPVAYLFGTPRYMIGKAARAIPTLAAGAVFGRWNAPATFAAELAVWDLCGFLLGKFGRTPDELAGLA